MRRSSAIAVRTSRLAEDLAAHQSQASIRQESPVAAGDPPARRSPTGSAIKDAIIRWLEREL